MVGLFVGRWWLAERQSEPTVGLAGSAEHTRRFCYGSASYKLTCRLSCTACMCMSPAMLCCCLHTQSDEELLLLEAVEIYGEEIDTLPPCFFSDTTNSTQHPEGAKDSGSSHSSPCWQHQEQPQQELAMTQHAAAWHRPGHNLTSYTEIASVQLHARCCSPHHHLPFIPPVQNSPQAPATGLQWLSTSAPRTQRSVRGTTIKSTSSRPHAPCPHQHRRWLG